MDKFLLLLLLVGSIASAWAQCQRTVSIGANSTPKQFTQCTQLQAQGASFAWSYYPENTTLDMAFTGTATSASGWVGWGYNPTKEAMDGSTALIAFRNGAGNANLLQYSLTGATKGGAPLVPDNSSGAFRVLNSSVAIQGTSVAFTALLQLNSASSNIFHVWNRGPVNNGTPGGHSFSPADLASHASLNVLSGSASSAGAANLHLKNAHGILNALSWGVLLPIGAMVARYLRPFPWADPAWFYIHASCQTLGYILGVVGWAIGLRLGSLSKGITRTKHRNIGITLFALATLQVFAMFLRPNKTHRIRPYWNVYHHAVGYATLLLAIINIFKGFDILQPASGWKHAYIGIIAALGAVAVVLEIVTWIAYFRRRRSDAATKPHHQQSTQFSSSYDQTPQQPRWDNHSRV